MPNIRQWNGKKIHIRPDRYVNATDMAKSEKKQLSNFLKSPETQKYLKVLSKKCNIPISKDTFTPSNRSSENSLHNNIYTSFLIEIVQVGKTKHTYFYPKLALRFAQWCSAEFAVEVDFWLDDLLQGKTSKTLPLGIDPSRHQLYRPLEDGKAKWEKTFFKPFYDVLYAFDDRINEEPHHQHPLYIAKMTVKYVYDEFEAIAPKNIIKELKTLRFAHEQQGVRGVKALHQFLSDEGRKILERTISTVTAYLKVAITTATTPETRRTAAEFWLLVMRGQTTLPVIENGLKQIGDFNHG